MSRPPARRPRPPSPHRQAPAPLKAGLEARRLATRWLERVVDGRERLDRLATAGIEPRDAALARAIVIAALRQRGRIAAMLSRLVDRPLPKGARHLSHVLHGAAAQILFLDTPTSAAVDLAVTQLRDDPRSQRFAALGNAVLRRLAGEGDALLAAVPVGPGNLPDWFARQLERDWGKPAATRLAVALAAEPALDLTPHARLSPADRARLCEALPAVELAGGSLRMTGSGAVTGLPGFAEGDWWVQDAASALVVRLFGPLEGRSAADLCAAPGGKTAQLAAGGARVLALDLSPERLVRLRANLERLGLAVETVAGDLLTFEPDRTFDAILIDAPCTATGTARRHPDVLWTRDGSEVGALVALQKAMIERAAGWLAPGGTLVYANCSLLKAEGEGLLAGLLKALPDGLVHVPVKPGEHAALAPHINAQGALRMVPDRSPATASGEPLPEGTRPGMDGFFAARFRRLPEGPR